MQSQLNSKSALGNILGDYQPKPVIIPKFQRGYSWEQKQVNELWNDLKDHINTSPNKNYFFGPMVINEKEESVEILDGQQRLATITMILCAIREIARQINTASTTTGFNKGNDLARDIQSKEIWLDEDSNRFKLVLGELDKNFFQEYIQSDPPKQVEPVIKSHDLIKKNYTFLLGNIQKEVDLIPLDEDKIQYLKKVRKALVSYFILYLIPVNNEEEAFQIFETLNDRGLRLSVPDLLLNYLMRISATAKERDDVRKNWDKIIESLGKKDISRFIRHAWISRFGDLKARSLFNELKNQITAGHVSGTSFVNNTLQDCNTYLSLTEQRNIPEESGDYVKGIIKYLNVQSAVPLLLSSLSSLNDAEFIKLSKALSKICVKYITIAQDNPDIIESKFYELARNIRSEKRDGKSSKQILKFALTELATLEPDQSRLEEKLLSVNLNRGEAIYILNQLTLGSISATKELGLDKVNLEHIYPQNAKSVDWTNLADLEKHVWKLGNLTILGEKLNQKAANDSFEKKKNNIYVNSEIKLTKDLTGFAKWDFEEITNRTKSLYSLFHKVFKL